MVTNLEQDEAEAEAETQRKKRYFTKLSSFIS